MWPAAELWSSPTFGLVFGGIRYSDVRIFRFPVFLERDLFCKVWPFGQSP